MLIISFLGGGIHSELTLVVATDRLTGKPCKRARIFIFERMTVFFLALREGIWHKIGRKGNLFLKGNLWREEKKKKSKIKMIKIRSSTSKRSSYVGFLLLSGVGIHEVVDAEAHSSSSCTTKRKRMLRLRHIALSGHFCCVVKNDGGGIFLFNPKSSENFVIYLLCTPCFRCVLVKVLAGY